MSKVAVGRSELVALASGVVALVLSALTPEVVHRLAGLPWWLRIPLVLGYLGLWGAAALVAGAALFHARERRRQGGASMPG